MTQMRWLELLSTVRIGSKKQSTEQARSPFHKDYDRIIFSQSFRQLNRKTQVHPLTQHDGIHARLTHSLEVSCIGRSLGMLAAEKIKDHLPMWISPADVGAIIQAACLAHDIGNPPFGHAGEYAIREWFDDASHGNFLAKLSDEEEADVRQFEGNAQGLRLLTKIDYHPNDGGMRLTYATLGAYLKYPWLSKTIAEQGNRPANQRDKFGCYQAEKEILKQIAEQLGLSKFVTVQNPYSLLNRTYEIGMSEIAKYEGVGLLAYSPLAFGYLTGKFRNGARPANARVTLFSRFSRYSNPESEWATEQYAQLAERHGLTPTQLALAFIKQQFFVTSTIIGATNLDQLKENIQAFEIDLSEEVLQGIQAIHQQQPNPAP